MLDPLRRGSEPMIVRKCAGDLRKRRNINITRALGSATLLFLTLFAEPSAAQNIIAYPAKGQSQEQQDRDRFECYNWAVQQTGYNPQAQQVGSTAPPPSGGPNALRGAAGGAALGAVGGAIGGNAGMGAAIGAATGGLFGGFRRRETEMQQQTQQQSAAASAQQAAGFNRAMGPVCKDAAIASINTIRAHGRVLPGSSVGGAPWSPRSHVRPGQAGRRDASRLAAVRLASARCPKAPAGAKSTPWP
jgi:hypothetical protein